MNDKLKELMIELRYNKKLLSKLKIRRYSYITALKKLNKDILAKEDMIMKLTELPLKNVEIFGENIK